MAEFSQLAIELHHRLALQIVPGRLVKVGCRADIDAVFLLKGIHDRLDLIDAQTLGDLRDIGWTPNVVAMDVFEWLARPAAARWDIVFATLFMHHFSPDALARLLADIAARSRIFFCCEPRRSALPLAASHLVGLLGAGPVMRQDAVFSVHAGFRAQELSALWPDQRAWQLREYRAGLFSHGLLATRWSGSE